MSRAVSASRSPGQYLASSSAPVAIGGLGGSGTRVVAQLLKELGFFLGADLNESLDNLWFTFLFKRPAILTADPAEVEVLIEAFTQRMSSEQRLPESVTACVKQLILEDRSPEFTKDWSEHRAASLLQESPVTCKTPWGWKEPNTHLLILPLKRVVPSLKYVHVTRNGLDLAFSANQNQLRLWGPHIIGPACEVSPFYALRYWRMVEERVESIADQLGPDFLLLNFDKLCVTPEPELSRLLDFVGISATVDQRRQLLCSLRKPPTLGRFRDHDLGQFDPEDFAFALEHSYFP